eukprot:maker-scaffold_6-snap-gene-13.2-mRNA-1 protein AED:0.34 eAED:0.34 QI:130/1/1/1/1/1/2/122/131
MQTYLNSIKKLIPNNNKLNINPQELENPQYYGFLYKRSHYLGKWRRRLFILKEKNLYFCETEAALPHGVVQLESAKIVSSINDNEFNRDFCFKIETDLMTYFFQASSEEERDIWLKKIAHCVVQYSERFRT